MAASKTPQMIAVEEQSSLTDEDEYWIIICENDFMQITEPDAQDFLNLPHWGMNKVFFYFILYYSKSHVYGLC